MNTSYSGTRKRPRIQVAECFGSAHSAYLILAVWISLIIAVSLALALL
ncbi:hypothetical protein ACWDYH_07055 [Nocardia goodfellowii]|uniref:Uncharacterized protein n=1 Tax=Nocardia goodfellowii TaxID=882446 RepID=A0ABS4QJ82_9NOCA|nr:hypothetical protein [Nocardia goodfellowii]MBP2191778.1 hypothetical protein [Nocardia goodfellowii]